MPSLHERRYDRSSAAERKRTSCLTLFLSAPSSPPSSPERPPAMAPGEGEKGQLVAWGAAAARLQGCQPGTAAWRGAPSKTTNFMSLIGHFLFVLILSLALEVHRPDRGRQRAGTLETRYPVLSVPRLCSRALGRGLRSNAPGH